MRKSRRIANLQPELGPLPRPVRRGWNRISLTVLVRNFRISASGGDLPNVYGEHVLVSGTASTGSLITMTSLWWRRDRWHCYSTRSGVPKRRWLLRNFQRFVGGLIQPTTHAPSGRAVVCQRTVQAHTWQDSVTLTPVKFSMEEVNASGVLRKGRHPR